MRKITFQQIRRGERIQVEFQKKDKKVIEIGIADHLDTSEVWYTAWCTLQGETLAVKSWTNVDIYALDQ